MKPTWEIYKYKLPLKTELSIFGLPLEERVGLVIKVSDEVGICGYGECAPLPGVHREGILECFREISRFYRNYGQKELYWENFNWEKPFFGVLEAPLTLYPSVQFAIEQAFFWYYLSKFPRPLEHFPHLETGRAEVNLCALVNMGAWKKSQLPQLVRQLTEKHYTTLKVKIARNGPDEDIAWIKNFHEISNGKIKIRLDANCITLKEHFLYYAKQLSAIDLDYIEDPFKFSHDYQELLEDCPKPVALDESLSYFYRHDQLDPNLLKGRIAAIVIKPSTFYGIHNVVKAMKVANSCRIPVVLSSVFEGHLSLVTHAFLSQLLEINKTPQGLDTQQYLAKDFFENTINFHSGRVEFRTKAPTWKTTGRFLHKIF